MGEIGCGRNSHTYINNTSDHQTSRNSLASSSYRDRRVSASHGGLIVLLIAMAGVLIFLFSTRNTVASATPAENSGSKDYLRNGRTFVPGVTESTEVITSLQITLDPPETLLGPTWKLDTHFNTLGRTPSVVGYISNTSAWGYLTSNLRDLTLLPGVVLLPGTTGNFDGCGVWLNSTYQDGSVVRGWYHAEAHSDCNASPSLKSVGYAESYDGGRTFVKPNYPNNKVISAPPQYTSPLQASEGDSHVLKVGNYLYMYFVVPRDGYKVHLARSLVSDGGKPGKWWKYYNGSFSQPGLGGESSALASGSVLGRAWVSYNAALGEFIGFSWSPTGFGLSLSPNGITWRRVTGDILSTLHQFHDRGPESGELIDYMSLIGLDGDPNLVGSEIWLYYMRVPAGQPMTGNTRYLVRRKMHIVTGNPSPTATPTATRTATNTSTPIPASTSTLVPTRTATLTTSSPTIPTVTPTAINTLVPTQTNTAFATNTRINTPIGPTGTPTRTQTNTALPTATTTSTSTTVPTNTPTSTPASTATTTLVPLSTGTSTPTNTPLPTQAQGGSTATAIPTNTATSTPLQATGTSTRTNTPVAVTATVTRTQTPMGTSTTGPTNTATLTTAPPTATATVCPLQFTDVLPDHTFYASIRCLACLVIINGYTSGCESGSPCFKPGNYVTRGQLAKIVAIAAGFVEPEGMQQYQDVAPDSTFFVYVWRLSNRGYVSGYACGGVGEPCVGPGNLPYFRPNSNITRAQISKVVASAAGYAEPVGSQQLQDVLPGSTFYDYIWRLVNHSIMGGYACGGMAGEPCIAPGNLPYFRPSASATRGQTAKIVSNTFFPEQNP